MQNTDYDKLKDMEVCDVNAHLHTPYSFSAFDSVSQAVRMAAEQGVKVVGINDFYSMDGYAAWDRETRAHGLYPLFNIEFISLNSLNSRHHIPHTLARVTVAVHIHLFYRMNVGP